MRLMGIKYYTEWHLLHRNNSGCIMWKMLSSKRSNSEIIIVVKPTDPQNGCTIFGSVHLLALPSEEVSILFISSLSRPSHYILEYLSIQCPSFNIGNSFRKKKQEITKILFSPILRKHYKMLINKYFIYSHKMVFIGKCMISTCKWTAAGI